VGRSVVLDAEAVHAVAHQRRGSEAARRTHALLCWAQRNDADVYIPAAVLIELYRGRPGDAEIDRVVTLAGRVIPTTTRIARVAGALLAKAGIDSRFAIEAVIVAEAVLLGDCIIASHDPDDLRALAEGHPGVKVLAI
jgi:predicted nucleic acid-binding protein